ncbi:MAG: rod shape-determining protein RodA [Legionellales bacterium]|nr:rod shape-determining protein RodA [Legionellales bacterium]
MTFLSNQYRPSNILGAKPQHLSERSLWKRFHIDPFLLTALLILTGMGLAILYSASNGNKDLVMQQIIRLGLAYVVMIIVAQISPDKFKLWVPWVFIAGVLLLIAVFVAGDIGKGARRWLDLGFIRFQPSEIMKLAIPIFLAWYLQERSLPPTYRHLMACALIIAIPVGLTAIEPDLGTAIMLACAGACVLFLSGIGWRLIIVLFALAAAATPLLWYKMHDYQRQRVLTFLNPESDPLGAGYHIIQSKIAIGSGGIFGKGWLQGTQSHLNFLPEHATDFIFGVCGEEFGLVGGTILISAFMLIVGRGLYISMQAQDTFTRLVAGGLSMAFFFSMFINIGMVTGILPVVGVPLPLVSYGGTSMVTLMASFGIIMSIHTHRKLLA